jgi:hypothetical protein
MEAIPIVDILYFAGAMLLVVIMAVWILRGTFHKSDEGP